MLHISLHNTDGHAPLLPHHLFYPPIGRESFLSWRYADGNTSSYGSASARSDLRVTTRCSWGPTNRIRYLRQIPPQPPSEAASRAPPLHIAPLNARSISNKSHVLNELFTRENMDFMFLTETWQKDKDLVHLKELCPAGCSIIEKPRLTRCGGGLAALYWDKFLCRTICSESFPPFESQTIKMGSKDMFYCVLVYCPPGPTGAFLTYFTNFLSTIIKLEKFLIVGDFILHVDNVICNTAVDLLSITDAFNSGPTHIKGHTLDLVFSLGLQIENVCVEDVHVSDHSCVFFQLNFPLDLLPLRPRAQRRIINKDVTEKFTALNLECCWDARMWTFLLILLTTNAQKF